eukprot:m.211569 g.211569  ORF g.211569 m.211569 type:complete len:86 (+) comp33104_c4_seq50:1511-1768(+)
MAQVSKLCRICPWALSQCTPSVLSCPFDQFAKKGFFKVCTCRWCRIGEDDNGLTQHITQVDAHITFRASCLELKVCISNNNKIQT